MIGAASGRALWANSYEEAYELLEKRAANEYQNPSQKLAAQLKALNMKIDSLANCGMQQVARVCDLCAGGHETYQCIICNDSVQYFQEQAHPVYNTYQPYDTNNPNISWSNNLDSQQPMYPYQQFGDVQYDLYGMQQQYAPMQPQFQSSEYQQQQFHEGYIQPQQFHPNANQHSENSELEECRQLVKSNAVALKTLETQIAQIAAALLNSPQGDLPSKLEESPAQKEANEHVNVVTLITGETPGGVEEEKIAEQEEKQGPEAETEVEQNEKLITSIPDKAEPHIYPPPPDSQRLQHQKVPFDDFGAMQFPVEDEECFKVDIIDTVQTHELDKLLKSDSLDIALQGEFKIKDGEKAKYVQQLNAVSWHRGSKITLESLGLADLWKSLVRLKPFCKEVPKLESQTHPDHLRYVNVDDSYTLPVVIATNLSGMKEEKLLQILIKLQSAIGWAISKVTGLNPSSYMHKILCEEGSKPFGEQLRPSDPPPVPPPEEGGSS